LPNEERIKYETDMVHYSKLWLGLAEALEVSPDKIDVTFVSPKTPRLLLYHIAKDGRLLFGKYSDFSRFRLKAVKMFFDAAPFRKATAVYLKKFIHAR